MTEAVPPTVLVTGALGQIGTELVSALRKRHGSDSVIASDIREIEDHPAINNGPFFTLDVLNKEALEVIIDENNVNIIYHLAAILSATGEKNPALCERVNIGGLANVLELARKHQLRVFSPSSIAVFGPDCPNNAPQLTPLNPTTTYGETKVSGEVMARYYWEVHGVDVRGLRYPGLISWKAPAGGGTTDYAVEIFHHAVTTGKYSCFVRPDTRLPMMYMDDAIRATLELMDAPVESISEARGGYNISGCSFSVTELVAEISKTMDQFECAYSPDIRQEYADSWPDSVDDSEASNDWGWKAEFGLEQLVNEMLTNLTRTREVEA
ncbi:MAG: NAD-dependent epimerase/dehydratase family protein [Candidatus Poseidoniales archaeon]|nr:NAD-dependent epimerase/dehydratase family protein [Candidatus Poseidoniales archaeon]